MSKSANETEQALSVVTRRITPEEINKGEGSRRGMIMRTGEVREVDIESRTVELAFSSERPVMRWFGEEVLDHSEGAMRTERLDQGAALLVNHDWDDQVGVVERIEIGSDRVGRASVRFGKGARADEVFQDVVDGIRRHVSFGYAVHKVEIENRKGKPDLVRVTDWEPFEISIVSVPADPSVGIGRQAGDDGQERPEGAPAPQTQLQKKGIAMRTINTRDADGNLVRANVDDDNNIVEVIEVIEQANDAARNAMARGAQEEQRRVRTIMEMGEQYGAEDLAREAVREGAKPVDFQRRLLDHLNERQRRPLDDTEQADVGMTDREVRSYSFLRLLRALANPTDRAAQNAAAFEFEAGRAAAEKMRRDPTGVMVPNDVLTRGPLNSDTSGSAAGDTGGFSIATDLMAQSFIDMLRNRSVLMQLATTMGGLVGNVDIPRQISGASGYWIGEHVDATEDGLELDQVSLSPKTVAARTVITRRLLMQSSLDMEALVRRDLATALALTIDSAGFYGTAAGDQPRGIKNYSGINAVDFGTDGGGGGTGQMPTYAEMVEMESLIAADNADVNSMAYVMNAGMRGHLKTTEKFAGSSGATVWEPGNTVNGYRAEVTNQITAGDVFFGNFADLMVGMWGGLELDTSRETQFRNGGIEVRALQDVDFVLRHAESFCYGADTTA